MSIILQTARLVLSAGIILPLAACGDSGDSAAKAKQIVRGLRTVLVKDEERTTERKYPSVLQPTSISTLSFEISGKLSKVNLDVGQVVKKGEVLARVDPRTLELKVDSAEAELRRSESSARTTQADFERKDALLKRGVVSAAVADQSRNEAESAKAKLVQAKKSLATAKEDLTKSVLRSPFDGIINTVSVDSFANVTPGAAVATVYSASSFEVSFSVNYDVTNRLAVGKKAVVRLADDPSVALNGHVSELGLRADTVSSFPVVVALDETDPALKAGMAVEVSMMFPVKNGKGFALPLSVLALEGASGEMKDRVGEDQATVYVFDEGSEKVNRRLVTIAGIRENSLIVVDGLEQGERVASAGVSFLRDGQKVKLLPDADGE
jgi:RND family efflux transporter MFP subunit